MKIFPSVTRLVSGFKAKAEPKPILSAEEKIAAALIMVSAKPKHILLLDTTDPQNPHLLINRLQTKVPVDPDDQIKVALPSDGLEATQNYAASLGIQIIPAEEPKTVHTSNLDHGALELRAAS